MSLHQSVEMWSCMSCGTIGHAQSCAACGAEAMPGEWVPKDVCDQLVEALRDADDLLRSLVITTGNTAETARAEAGKLYRKINAALVAAS